MTSHGGQLLRRAQTRFRDGKRLAALGLGLAGAVLAPGLAFEIIIYPPLRRRIVETVKAASQGRDPAAPPAPALPPSTFTAPQPASADSDALSVLVINPDMPKYGARFHEFTNTVGLAATCRVGLITQLSDASDHAHVRRLEDAGVTVYSAGPFGIPAPPGPAASGDASGRERVTVRGLVRSTLRAAAAVLNLPRPWPAEIYVNRRTLTNLAEPLRRALAERQWDRIVIIQSSFAEWIDWLPTSVPVILVLHDVRTQVFLRRAEVAEGIPARLGAYWTARRYRAFENAYLKRFAAVICLSDIDAGHIERWFGLPRARLPIVPLPVDTDYFRPAPSSDTPSSSAPVLMFPGMMNHRPNVDGALWFVRAVLPRIRQRHPTVRFVIAGMTPVAEIRALDGHDGITVTGTVPDMRPYFHQAAVVVVPLRIGSGARNKILEAWACHRPVVSTGVGAEGLTVADGDNLCLANDAEAFATAVSALLERPETGLPLIAGGARAVAAHTPDRVVPRYHAAVTAAGTTDPNSRPLHLAFDLRWMIPGSAGGLEQHARALIDALLERVQHPDSKRPEPTIHTTLILPLECRTDFDRHRQTPKGRLSFRVICRDGPAADFGRVLRVVGRTLGARLGGSAVRWPDLWALADRRRLNADLVYSFNGIHPELTDFRHVVMIPDIQHEYLPEFFSAATLVRRRQRLDDAIARAAHLCVISDFTRTTLIERLKVAPERITVTPLAADPQVFGPASPGETPAAELARRFGLEAGRYLFLPAHTWPHKNHRTLIAALAQLRAEGCPIPTLVCSGGAREAQSALEHAIAAAELEDRVRFLGYRSQAEIRLLYQGALAMAFPSLFEGFGLPVLEAMACGCPVISSDASCLPEVAGNAALLVKAEDVAGWAAAIRRLLNEPELRATLAHGGPVQAARFSWHHHAEQTLTVLQTVESRKFMKRLSG